MGLTVLLFSPGVYSQIGSPDADAEREISYSTYTGNDKVFIYYSHPGESVTGTLRADAPQSGNFDFEWSRYNSQLNNWDPFFLSDASTEFSVASGLENGGYRVHVSNGADVDTFYYGWVFIDKLFVDVEETANERIKPFKYTCDFLILNGSVSVDSFFYYDPISHEKIELMNGASFLWTSDNPDLDIPNDDRVLDPNTTYRPPVEDTWYILTATDSFGMEDRDSVFYETIHVKAEFSFEFFDKADSEEFVEAPSPTQDDAPLEVRFTNESINGATFEWIFADTIDSKVYANEFTEDVNYQPVYTYKIPDDYFPKLIAKSQEGCVDSFKVEEPIEVIPSELEAPNVFSPEGLEQNRYFKVKFASIKSFTIRIYSRTGNLVYKADVKDMYSWDGWDGNVLNSNRPATPGPYFYVIEATGYDEIRYNDEPYTGIVYLFRPKE